MLFARFPTDCWRDHYRAYRRRSDANDWTLPTESMRPTRYGG